MQTNDLIAELSREATSRPRKGVVLPFWLAVVVAPFAAFAVFMPMLGPRPDALASVAMLRFDMKFVTAGLLALAALVLLASLARPARPWRERLPVLLLPAAVLFGAVAIELSVVPEHLWETRAMGGNAMNCLIAIPTMGAPVLALFLFALSRQAPTRPVLAGAIAGLASAGISALFYASHCPDDSPLFVALWYPLATLILVAAGALAGNRLLRW